MKDELEQALAKEFPFMRRERSIAEQLVEENFISDLYGAFGLEMGDGWFQLIWDMCAEITAVYDAIGEPVDVVMDQAKEKYGELRIYHSYKSRSVCPPALREAHRQVGEIVEKYVELSLHVCEECGEPGEHRGDLPWMQTLCEKHYQEARAAHLHIAQDPDQHMADAIVRALEFGDALARECEELKRQKSQEKTEHTDEIVS